MKLTKTSSVTESLKRIVDNISTDLGITCPESIILDAIAVSGREQGLAIRYCCRRNMNSGGLLSHHFLVIDNCYILRCKPTTPNKHIKTRHHAKNNRSEPCFTRTCSNTIIECVRLCHDKC